MQDEFGQKSGAIEKADFSTISLVTFKLSFDSPGVPYQSH